MKKTHSQCVAPGYAEYYLWVIRLQDDKDIVTTVVPEYAWTTELGAKYFRDLTCRGKGTRDEREEKSLSDTVYDTILEMILHYELVCGERIP